MGTKLNNETNSEGNNKLVLISIFFLFLCLTSCIAEQPANVTTYINLLDKIKDFLAFSCLMFPYVDFQSCFILDNSSNYYGQVISRIYYAYYTLARIININKTEYDNSYGGSHEHIWNNIKNNFIYPGQQLIVKGGTSANTNTGSTTSAAKPNTPNTSAATST